MYTASMKPFGYTDPIYQIRYGLKKTLKNFLPQQSRNRAQDVGEK